MRFLSSIRLGDLRLRKSTGHGVSVCKYVIARQICCRYENCVKPGRMPKAMGVTGWPAPAPVGEPRWPLKADATPLVASSCACA